MEKSKDRLIHVAVAKLDIPSRVKNRVCCSLCQYASDPEDKYSPYACMISDLPSTFHNPVMTWKNIGKQTAKYVENFLTQYGWVEQPDKTWTKEESDEVPTSDQSKLEGELDSLITWQTILDRVISEMTKTLNRSTEERRKLQETIRNKKQDYYAAFGYNSKYAPWDSKPSDIEEPSGE